MHWTDAIDSYCERTDASYWAEPVNALSNLSFVVAAVVAWRIARTAGDRPAQLLAVAAALVGVGSFLFHTHATRWALQADVWPIRVFVLLYVAVAVVRLLGVPRWAGVAAAAGSGRRPRSPSRREERWASPSTARSATRRCRRAWSW